MVRILGNMRSIIRIPAVLLIAFAVSSLLVGTPISDVKAQAGDFIVSISPSRITVGTDGIARYSVRVTSVGEFSGTVKLSVTDVAAGSVRTSFSFQPSVLQLSVDSEVYSALTMIGTFESSWYQSGTVSIYTVTFNVAASGSGITRSVAASADVLYGASTSVQQADVSIDIQPNLILTSGEITQAKSVTLDVTISPKATLTSGQLLFTTTPQLYDPPGGLYVSFNPTSVEVRAGQVSKLTVTLTMTPEFLERSGTLIFILGISGLISRSIIGGSYYQDIFITKTGILTVVVPPFFNIALKPSILNVYIGGADQTLEIVVTPLSRGLSQAITLTVEGIPAGLVSSFERDTLIPRGKEALSSSLFLNAPSTVKPGVFPIRISATTMGTTRIANASLNVRPSGDYSLTLDQTVISLSSRGESRSVTLTVVPQGDFRTTIEFSVTNVPSGITATLSSKSATVQVDTPTSVVLTLTAGSDVQSGTYDLAIVADTGFSTKTISLTLLIRVGTVEIWPVVLVVVILIAVVSAIIFVGMPKGRRVYVRRDMRRLPS